MILQVVSIRDRAADAFTRPVFVHTTGQAIRSFQDEINREAADNEMQRHPEDFDLYHLAHYDDQTGQFRPLDNGPQQLAIGKQLKR